MRLPAGPLRFTLRLPEGRTLGGSLRVPARHSLDPDGDEGPSCGAAVYRLDEGGWAAEVNASAALAGSRRLLLPGDRIVAINGVGPADPRYLDLTSRITVVGDEQFTIDLERGAAHVASRDRPLHDVYEYLEDQVAALNEGRQWGSSWRRFTRLEA